MYYKKIVQNAGFHTVLTCCTFNHFYKKVPFEFEEFNNFTSSTKRYATCESSIEKSINNEILEDVYLKEENIKKFRTFVSSRNYRNKIPDWVFEKIDRPTGLKRTQRSKCRFKTDTDLSSKFTAKLIDYAGLSAHNLSRGHLACVQYRENCQEDLNETFLFNSNIIPQDLSINQNEWFILECLGSQLAELFEQTYSISGPLWLPDDFDLDPKTVLNNLSANKISNSNNYACIKRRITYDVIGPSLVAVPTHLFKIYIVQTPIDKVSQLPETAMAAFIVPNKRTENFTVHIVLPSQIEHLAGFSLADIFKYANETLIQTTFDNTKKNINFDQESLCRYRNPRSKKKFCQVHNLFSSEQG